MEAVTTFNVEQYGAYGSRMLSTFRRHWRGIPLVVYAEGFDPLPEDESSIRYLDLNESSDWLAKFKQDATLHPAPKGAKDYKFAAARFSHKIAALTAADRCTSADYLIWLDGDIVAHAPFGLTELEPFLPAVEWVSWLDRQSTHVECGFYIINRRHERHAEAMSKLESQYRDQTLYALPEWHDSYVLQHVVQSNSIPAKSISGRGRSTHHPLVNGPLGKYLDHLKGDRKKTGKSFRNDLVIPRREAYWR